MKAYVFYDELGKDFREEPIPEDMQDLALEYREKLIEAVSDEDDGIMELFLEGEDIPEDMIRAAIRKATIGVRMVPVTCGTSYRNKGVQELLDAIVAYMPSPLDKKGITGVNPKTEKEEFRPASDDAPFAALAFKIATDPFVGKLCFFRVYSGTVEKGKTVLNSTKDKRERLGKIMLMHANHREEVDQVYSGDIAAVVGVRNTTTGDTFCDEKHPIILESMEFPEPVIRIAIEPKTKAGQEKMGIALSKLAEEDPTFKYYTDTDHSAFPFFYFYCFTVLLYYYPQSYTAFFGRGSGGNPFFGSKEWVSPRKNYSSPNALSASSMMAHSMRLRNRSQPYLYTPRTEPVAW